MNSCVKQIALSILSRLISRELFCTAFSPFRTTVVFSFAYIIISLGGKNNRKEEESIQNMLSQFELSCNLESVVSDLPEVEEQLS